MVKTITDQNDFFFYFEIIRQVSPESVLDFGMFLKRIGAVSRSVKNMSFSDSVLLTGIDQDKTDNLGIYENVYDSIISEDELPALSSRYALAIYINDKVTEAPFSEECRSWLRDHADHIALKTGPGYKIADIRSDFGPSVRPITIEQNEYALVTLRNE